MYSNESLTTSEAAARIARYRKNWQTRFDNLKQLDPLARHGMNPMLCKKITILATKTLADLEAGTVTADEALAVMHVAARKAKAHFEASREDLGLPRRTYTPVRTADKTDLEKLRTWKKKYSAYAEGNAYLVISDAINEAEEGGRVDLAEVATTMAADPQNAPMGGGFVTNHHDVLVKRFVH